MITQLKIDASGLGRSVLTSCRSSMVHYWAGTDVQVNGPLAGVSPGKISGVHQHFPKRAHFKIEYFIKITHVLLFGHLLSRFHKIILLDFLLTVYWALTESP